MVSNEDVERYLLRIFSGKDIVPIRRLGRDVFIVFMYPTIDRRVRANAIYDESFKRALNEGMLPLKDLEHLIKERNLYTEEDEEKVEKLESQIEAQEILLAKTTKVKANQDRIKRIIKNFREQLNEIKQKKLSKLGMSAENKAEEYRIEYLCWASSYEDDEQTRCWQTYEDFKKETDLDFKDELLMKFMRFYSGIDTTTLRIIARHNLWRIRYVTSQKTSEQLFGVPTSEYTNDMLGLTYWSNFYQNVYEMMPENRPPDSIIEDDEALDAYMNSYYEERNREDASRRSRSTTSGKLSAFDKEEVIITKSNELYQDIEYDKPREAQRLKDKEISSIRKKARKRKR